MQWLLTFELLTSAKHECVCIHATDINHGPVKGLNALRYIYHYTVARLVTM